MSSFQLFASKTIIPIVCTIMLATFAWKHNFIHSLQIATAVSLFFLATNYFSTKKNLFCALALFIPLTSIIIKYRINKLHHDQEYQGKPIALEATITSVCSSYDKDISTLCTATINYILCDNKKIILKKNIHLFLPPKVRIKNYEKIFLKKNIIHAPPENSYKIFCLQNDIWGIVHAQYADYKIKQTPESSQITVFDRILKKLSLKTKILFDLIFLGKKDKGYISQQVQHQSLYWGVSHIIARSGLHLSIIFLLLLCMLAALPIPYQYKTTINLACIIIFFISTPYSTSFNRAFLMIVAYLLSQIHKVQPNSEHLLSILTLFILLHNPFTSLFLSFQLSFGITYIIIKALSSHAQKKHCFRS